ncbi:MFS general substrate transporter [Xylariaceae sp. FL1272]|nr:MFS general substrate transporter [Xylariaceae sp. FL1272]
MSSAGRNSTTEREKQHSMEMAEPPSHQDKDGSSAVQPMTPPNEQDESAQYPGTWQAILLTAGLCLVTFATAVDNTILATAVPKITADFNSLNDVGWYASSYLLASAGIQPSYGKVYTLFNVKWTYLAAIIVFEIGSVVAATARTSSTLIIGRAIAGLGGGGLTSGGSTILALIVPLNKRAIFVTSFAATFGVASVIGPLLGGVLTDRLSWRWCFWINLPIGGAAFLAVIILFQIPEQSRDRLDIRTKLSRLDLLGAFFLISAVASLLLALQWGGTVLPWSDSRVWGTILAFGLLIIVFFAIQVKRKDNATIPLRILSKRAVLSSTIFQAFLSMGLYTHFYYLAFYFQVIQNTSAMDSGLRTIPYVASLSLLAIIAGIGVRLLGYYAPFAWIGSAIYTVGAGLLSTLNVGTAQPRWVGYQILAGGGAGTAFQMPLLAVHASLEDKDVPIGNALIGFFMTIGSSIGVAIAQNIFASELRRSLNMIDGLDAELVISAGAADVRDVTPENLLSMVIAAYQNVIGKTFIFPIVSGGLAWLCSLLFEWKSLKLNK